MLGLADQQQQHQQQHGNMMDEALGSDLDLHCDVVKTDFSMVMRGDPDHRSMCVSPCQT